MFSKATLTFLAIGVLSVNALTTPVARSPAPESESQELEARTFLFSREPRTSDELFSREPEDWAEWAGFARDYFMAKRDPPSGNRPVFRKKPTLEKKPTLPPPSPPEGWKEPYYPSNDPTLPKFKPILSPTPEVHGKRELLD